MNTVACIEHQIISQSITTNVYNPDHDTLQLAGESMNIPRRMRLRCSFMYIFI